jgi:cysteine-rich repeat protein
MLIFYNRHSDSLRVRFSSRPSNLIPTHFFPRNFSQKATIYYSWELKRFRIDFKEAEVVDDNDSPFLAVQLSDFTRNLKWEIADGRCVRYSMAAFSQMLELFVPQDAVSGGAFMSRGVKCSLWQIERTSDHSTTTINYVVSPHGALFEVWVSDDWGRREKLHFYNIDSSDPDEVHRQLTEPKRGKCVDSTKLYQEASCPSSCNFRGICMKGICYCHHLFYGEGCGGVPSWDVPIGICGNGIVEGNEECDDGNTMNTGCCSSTCKIIKERIGQPCETHNTCTLPLGHCSAQGTCIAPPNPTGTCTDMDECTVDRCVGPFPAKFVFGNAIVHTPISIQMETAFQLHWISSAPPHMNMMAVLPNGAATHLTGSVSLESSPMEPAARKNLVTECVWRANVTERLSIPVQQPPVGSRSARTCLACAQLDSKLMAYRVLHKWCANPSNKSFEMSSY